MSALAWAIPPGLGGRALRRRRRDDWPRLWLASLCLALAGYAVMGKGFAYLIFPPIFIGEILLAAGLALLLTCPGWRRLAAMPTVWWFALLVVWGLARTLPYVGRYKADALRDAVIWGYGLYMVVVAAWLASRPDLVGFMLRAYRRFAMPFLLIMPAIWLMQQLAREAIPTWPWANVEMIHAKGGDVLVHLGGVAALAIVGLFPSPSLLWPAILLANVGLAGVVNRGGMVSFGFACLVAFWHFPRSPWLQRLIVVGIMMLAVMLVAEPRLEGGSKRRQISFEQLSANVMSIVGDVRTSDLDDTKQWRLEWWTKIVQYTIAGPYRWTGKGFGINLADDDGFQVNQDGSLRSPHNGHLTMLARGGVPGLALWLAVHLSFVLCMLRGIWTARRRGDRVWFSLFTLVLAYWLAFIVNASFDVFIEGPMGGIWMWTLMGVGLGATWVYRHAPQAAGLNPAPLPPAGGARCAS